MQYITQANYLCIEGEAVLAAWHLKAASAPEGGKRLLASPAWRSRRAPERRYVCCCRRHVAREEGALAWRAGMRTAPGRKPRWQSAGPRFSSPTAQHLAWQEVNAPLKNNARTPCTRGDGCEPAGRWGRRIYHKKTAHRTRGETDVNPRQLELCSAPGGEFLKIRKNRHQRHHQRLQASSP